MNIWIELENLRNMDGTVPDIQNEASNVLVTLDNGNEIGLNVWTYKFLQSMIEKDAQSGENLNGLYQIPPDLLVTDLSRECVEKSITDLVVKGLLNDLSK